MSLYHVLPDRSTMQLRQGDLCIMGEVIKARKARTNDPKDVRFIFTLKRGGNVRELSERDFGSETLTIWRPRPGTQITSLPPREA